MIVRIVVLVGGLPTYCNREKVVHMARTSVLDAAIVLPDADDAVTNDAIAAVFASREFDAMMSWVEMTDAELRASDHNPADMHDDDYYLVHWFLEEFFEDNLEYEFHIDETAFAAFLREMV